MHRAITIAAALVLAAACNARALEAGVASADITPDVKAFRVPMAGYGARLGRPSTGIHDPLRAKALYLRDGPAKVAIVTCDLRSITPEFKSQIARKTAGLGLDPDHLFLAASHTHDGPSMYPEKFWQMQFGAYDPQIVEIMSDAVAKALENAAANATAVRIGFGEGRAEGFTRNRRWEYDAEARRNAGETPALDPVLWSMRVDNADGTVKAVLVNFASHPTIIDQKNMLLSAEWPGALQDELEKALPGAVAMFTNGAEGDQAPAGAQGADEFDRAKDYGTRLAQLALPILRGIKTQPNLRLGCVRVTPRLPDPVFPENAKQKFAPFAQAALEGLPRTAELQIVRIGPVALAGLPGEPLMEVGLEVAKSVAGRKEATSVSVASQGFEKAVVVGLTNDYIGYLVNEKEYAHGGYEVESRSYYGPGLGRFLAEEMKKAAATLESAPPR